MGILRLTLRFIGFLILTIAVVVRLMIAIPFSKNKLKTGIRIRLWYARLILPVLGVTVEKEGEAPEGPCILMSSHRSYLDPVILVTFIDCLPVSKAEVASWPLIGYGAKISGVVFLKRESRDSRKRTLQAIADQVEQGFTVLLFPEGTTHSNDTTSQIRKGGFQLAVDNNIPTVPIALDYRYQKDHWIGDDDFLSHFTRRFRRPKMPVRIAFGPTITDEDAKERVRKTQEWIDARLLEWKKEGYNGPD